MKKLLALSMALILAMSLASIPAFADAGTLTVYTAFPEAEVVTYLNAFQEETGITVNYIRLSAGEMLTRVAAEAENPQASIMFGGSTDNYIAAVNQGLLEPYQAPTLDKVPAEYIDPTGTWNPIYVGVIAFACSTEWFESNDIGYPGSWADLLKPEFKDQIIMAHPSTSGTAYTVLATLVQLMGDEAVWPYLTKLNENIMQYTKSGAAAPNSVALGEAAIALTFSHDGLQPTAEGYDITLSFPSEGTGFEVGAVAMIKGGPAAEQENAKKFIDWACSTACQDLYASNQSFRVPTNSEAVVADGLVTLDQVNVIDYDAVWAAGVKSEYTEKFESAISTKPEA